MMVVFQKEKDQKSEAEKHKESMKVKIREGNMCANYDDMVSMAFFNTLLDVNDVACRNVMPLRREGSVCPKKVPCNFHDL
jgi:hypothetical protein